jgi:DNA-binding transcriptional MocR family regulator
LYGNLTFGQTRPKAAKAFDQDGCVMLCDSFTKTLSPGYRVGWVSPGRFREKIEFLKFVNTAANPSLPQMAIAEFLQNGGFDQHLRKIRRCYAEQMQCMSAAVSQYFPPGTKATRPNGGMCLWVELPQQVNSLNVYQQAMAAKISTAPGPIFSAKQKFQNFIRLNFGNPWTERIENAVRDLGRIVHRCAESPAAGKASRAQTGNSAAKRGN